MGTNFHLLSQKNGPLFGTFRLQDNDNNTSKDNESRPRKRIRTTLSCSECYRSKVKCDRARPCARCISSGREKQCTYNTDHNTATTPTQPTQNTGSSTQMYYHRGEATIGSGRTHWASAICEDAAQYIFGLVPDFQDTFQLLTQLKDLYPARTSHNFPFSHKNSVSRTTIIEKLPSRAQVQMLVENYFNTFDQTHPLLDSPRFEKELSEFWITPEKGCDKWLTQLLMMLSLSCTAANRQILDELSHEKTDRLGKDCLGWAAALLGCASPPYMDFPDLNTIRTLCMMLIAKSFDIETPTSGGQWALEGFLVRLAMSMSLHRDPATMSVVPIHEVDIRRKIWNTIVFLDLSAAIDSGLPATIKPNDWDTASTCKTESGDSSDNTVYFQTMLARSYPEVALVLSWVNSPTLEMTYDKVLDCNNKIRSILREADNTFAMSSSTTTSKSAKCKQAELLQHTMLTVFLRRTLLALHRPYDRGNLQQIEFATSHWSVLECSLALLHAQQKLYEKIDDSPSVVWFADLFQSDFAVAMLYVILGLRRGSFSDMSPNEEEGIGNIPNGTTHAMARTTTRTALQASFEIIKLSAGRSFHLFKILLGTALSVAALEASESQIPLAEAMETAAQSIIEVVRRSRGKKRPTR